MKQKNNKFYNVDKLIYMKDINNNDNKYFKKY